MSPEHARGETLDARADVFAAGIVLWELISGRRMYRQAGANGSLLEQARRAAIPPLVARGLSNEPELHRIALKALAPERDARYPSAAAMLRDLEAYMSEAKLVASSLKLGSWLETHFGTELLGRRRMRQRAADALEKGPPVVLTPLGAPSSPALEAPAAKVRAFTRNRAIGVALAVLVAFTLALASFLRRR
jgi:hypothetical protein